MPRIDRKFTDTDGVEKLWKASMARARFRKAFMEDYERPSWLLDVTILPEPHDKDNAMASFNCGGPAVLVKVFKFADDVGWFFNHYPDATLTPVVVSPYDTFEDIRKNTLDAVEEHMFTQ
ncbi:MAG: hypothetical protein JWN49_73 [Parcubacteria group bacterium]|nr:hypothetical protein [Parcubacteria group bacterium]